MRESTGQQAQMAKSLRVLFLVLIVLSSGLTALFAGASPTTVALLMGAGLVGGYIVVEIAIPSP